MASPKKIVARCLHDATVRGNGLLVQKSFEATVQYRNPALAFLKYDDEHHRFAFANNVGPQTR